MIAVVGRFPPPIDGQTLATARLARVLEDPDQPRVVRVNTEPAGSVVAEKAPRTIGRAAHFMRLRGRMSSRLKETDTDIILWASISPGVAGHFRDIACVVPAFPQSSRRLAIVHRGNFDRLFTSRLTRFTASRLVSKVDRFVFLSHDLSERCSEFIPSEKRLVIPNTIDEDLLFSASELDLKRRTADPATRLNVLFLSNMIPSKGFFDVLAALIALPDHDVRAEFAGAWENETDRSQFEAMAEQAMVRNRITVHGPVRDRGRIRELLQRADALILPTYYPNEAQPLVILEAMNAGVPVIATRHGAIPEMVEDGRNGFLVPARAPGEIAQSLRRLMKKDTWLAQSNEARTVFDSRFSPSAVREQWLDAIRNL